MALVDHLADLQAGVLSPFGDQALYQLFRIADPGAFRRALESDLLLRLTSEQQIQSRKEAKASLTLAFTHAGLEMVGVPASIRNELSRAFVEGMAERATRIGDGGDSDPVEWEEPFGTGAIHFVLCSKTSGPVAAVAAPAGTVEIGRCAGAALFDAAKRRIEPFGFADPVIQPQVFLAAEPAEPAEPGDEDGPIAAGEFVLGHPSESDRQLHRPPAPPPTEAARLARELERNGSYMVFRKIEQDVARFERAVGSAAKHDRSREAAVMGRHRDGSAPEPVPPDSHVGRANPINRLPASELRMHRILRRGIPYAEDGRVGLLFVCFNARIEEQFEVVQGDWLNEGNIAGVPSGRIDRVAGTAHPTAGRGDAHDLPYTKLRGGEYLLLPGLAALARIARADLPDPGAGAGAARPAGRLFDEPDPERVKLFLQNEVEPAELVLDRSGARKERVGWFVASHAKVAAVLDDDVTYTTEPYRRRIAPMTGGLELMVSEPAGSEARKKRLALLGKLWRPEDETRVAAIARDLLQKLRPGRVDVVADVARAIPLAVLEQFMGVGAPADMKPSLAEIAVHYGRRPHEIPEEWWTDRKNALRGVHIGRHNLAFWTRMLFAETFANVYEQSELKLFAAAAAKEYREHLEGLTPPPDSLFDRLRNLDPALAIPMILELSVGGTDTTTMAISNLVHLFLTEPRLAQVLQAAVAEGAADAQVDAVLLECLRFDAPAPLLPREVGPAGATLGTLPLPAGTTVYTLPGVAGFDPRATQAGQSPPSLVFGAGPRVCKGRHLAMAQLREVARALFDPKRRLRPAGGPRGRRIRHLRFPVSHYVRIDGAS